MAQVHQSLNRILSLGSLELVLREGSVPELGDEGSLNENAYFFTQLKWLASESCANSRKVKASSKPSAYATEARAVENRPTSR
jgi:hypothetical protein